MKCFDSILVRLKENDVALATPSIATFRFHTGSIKSNTCKCELQTRKTGFDSILVRLKVPRTKKGVKMFQVSIPYWFD